MLTALHKNEQRFLKSLKKQNKKKNKKKTKKQKPNGFDDTMKCTISKFMDLENFGI